VRTSCHDHHSAIFGPPQVEPLLPGEAEGGQVDRRGLHRLGCTFPFLDRLPPIGRGPVKFAEYYHFHSLAIFL